MSKFQQRHYEAMALMFQDGRDQASDLTANAANGDSGRAESFARGFQMGIEWMQSEVAMEFAQDNPLFDREHFDRACIPGANVKNRTR